MRQKVELCCDWLNLQEREKRKREVVSAYGRHSNTQVNKLDNRVNVENSWVKELYTFTSVIVPFLYYKNMKLNI